MADVKAGPKQAMGVTGHHLSDVVKTKISNALRGRRHSEEARRRRSEFTRGKANPFFGRHHSPETKLKIREAKIGVHTHTEEQKRELKILVTGEANPFYGKHHTAETLRIISEKAIGREISSETKTKMARASKLKWQDPNFREKTLAAQRLGRAVKPNALERRVLKVIETGDLPYKYTGDGSFVIHGYNPDFVQVNGKKKVIEIFGDYWHKNGRVVWHRTELGRLGIYLQFGFDCLILWQSEIEKLSDEELTEIISQYDKRKIKAGGGRW